MIHIKPLNYLYWREQFDKLVGLDYNNPIFTSKKFQFYKNMNIKMDQDGEVLSEDRIGRCKLGFFINIPDGDDKFVLVWDDKIPYYFENYDIGEKSLIRKEDHHPRNVDRYIGINVLDLTISTFDFNVEGYTISFKQINGKPEKFDRSFNITDEKKKIMNVIIHNNIIIDYYLS